MPSDTMPPLPSAVASEPTNVVVEIGPEKKKYYLQKSLLAAHSEYFVTAVGGLWKEAQDGVIKLEDVDYETFEFFADWMYTQRLSIHDEHWSRTFDDDEADHIYEIVRIKATIFGNRILAYDFETSVRINLTRVMVSYRHCPHETIVFAFENLSTHDPILELLVDRQIKDFNEILDYGGMEALQKDLPHEFLVRFMVRHGNVRSDTKWHETGLDECNYHRNTRKHERKECKKEAAELVALEERIREDSLRREGKLSC
ncbi:hypothetical protein NX059_008744 [Plenodomus lindquistii]|nr:hypothetical protein NX059_008744 [Plenodomus lindquistii]